MKIKINGILLANSLLDYNRIHKAVQDNTYNGIGDALTIKISDAIQHSEWYQHTPNKMDLFKDWDHVQAICGTNKACYMDSFSWSVMDKTELTADIYKFITDRTAIVREGFENNFIPHHHLDFSWVFNLIDWHFILDCISWFF
jgi:hypothetical protein